MTPSRNDQCPCGSGRKYKRCCLNTMPVRGTLESLLYDVLRSSLFEYMLKRADGDPASEWAHLDRLDTQLPQAQMLLATGELKLSGSDGTREALSEAALSLAPDGARLLVLDEPITVFVEPDDDTPLALSGALMHRPAPDVVEVIPLIVTPVGFQAALRPVAFCAERANAPVSALRWVAGAHSPELSESSREREREQESASMALTAVTVATHSDLTPLMLAPWERSGSDAREGTPAFVFSQLLAGFRDSFEKARNAPPEEREPLRRALDEGRRRNGIPTVSRASLLER